MERRVTDAEKALMDRIAERAGVPLGEVTNISADHSDGGDWRITVERAPITLHLNRDEWSALQEG